MASAADLPGEHHVYNAALEGRMRNRSVPAFARSPTHRPAATTVAYGGVDFRFRNTTGAPI